MLLKELLRFSTQNRTFYCYLILSLWIFLLMAGMYKYMTNNTHSLGSIFSYSHAADNLEDLIIVENIQKFEKYKTSCSPISQITRGEDGGILEGWKLQGLLLVMRHGDRGPMSHVRNVNNVNCGLHGDALVNRYRSFLYNATPASGANHMYWNKVGPFHGFALLPVSDNGCYLGQLTYKGIGQQLHIGEILHQIYGHSLGLLSKVNSGNKMSITSTPHSLLNSDEVVLYSTRYRRTFQSALALLYTFLPPDKWLSLNIKESHSMAFCFSDCACYQADVLRKKTRQFYDNALTLNKEISNAMQMVGSALLEHTPDGIKDLSEVVDATLTILCNDAPLPCRQYGRINYSLNYYLPTSTTITSDVLNELGDTINIDQEEQMMTNSIDMNKAGGGTNDNFESQMHSQNVISTRNDEEKISTSCIETHHIETLMSYAIEESAKEANDIQYKRIGLLRAYGMMRHLVSCMLKMISGDRTKLVLYSGHSKTLQYLTAAMGIRTETTYISYASRMAFEVYKSETHTDYYFRVVYNGKDVTQQIDFCEGGKSLRVTRDSRGNKADLCPIENIIRFLHEDYFAPLNATNFKDACTTSNLK